MGRAVEGIVLFGLLSFAFAFGGFVMAGDGSLLRPFIVFFGEAVPMIEPAAREAMDADIFIIIGTSLNVYPAAGLVRYVKAGVPVYLIDPKPVTASVSGVKQIQKGASEGMKELMKILCPSN